ncbi:MAG: T9SS type A sorting domain-containing protein [Bacteroidia bacterium]|nr:T9SS type A sorting domain-containing protein [Bacteroidia bacterium]
MYCKIIVCLIFIWLSFLSKAQTNLVPNGSFEDLDTCDVGWNKLVQAAPWFQPYANIGLGGSSDVWNSCSNNPLYSVPFNQAGSQIPRTGNGYAGICVYLPQFPNEGREYIEIGLSNSLIIGKRYKVEFYASPAINVWFHIGIAGIAAYLSSDSLIINNNIPIIIPPNVSSPIDVPIIDTVNWTKIQGEYVAKGGEKFLTIGNFLSHEDVIYDTIGEPSIDNNCCRAYYFIDDVSVTEIDTSIGIPEPIQANCKFYQTEDQKWVIESTGRPSKLSIYNTIGQLVYEHIPKQNKETIELSLDQGIYYWQAGVSRGKILVK